MPSLESLSLLQRKSAVERTRSSFLPRNKWEPCPWRHFIESETIASGAAGKCASKSLSGIVMLDLHTTEFLRGLSDQELQLVLSKASDREVPRGTTVFRQAEPAGKIFLLISGRVRLHEVTGEGDDLLLRFVVPGDVFGDKAAMVEEKYGASARADQPSRVISWTTSTMQELMKAVP